MSIKCNQDLKQSHTTSKKLRDALVATATGLLANAETIKNIAYDPTPVDEG